MGRRGLTYSPAFEIIVRGHSIKRVVRPPAVVEGEILVDERGQPGDIHGGVLDVVELVPPCRLHPFDAAVLFRGPGRRTARVMPFSAQASSNPDMDSDPPPAWTAASGGPDRSALRSPRQARPKRVMPDGVSDSMSGQAENLHRGCFFRFQFLNELMENPAPHSKMKINPVSETSARSAPSLLFRDPCSWRPRISYVREQLYPCTKADNRERSPVGQTSSVIFQQGHLDAEVAAAHNQASISSRRPRNTR